MKEIELKFFDINLDTIKSKIEDLWARFEYESDIEDYAFIKEDFSVRDTSKPNLRVRKIDEKTFIAYKSPSTNPKVTEQEEVEFEASDFETALCFFERLGYKKVFALKKTRTHYKLWNIHFEFDTLSFIPTYLEIETQTEKDMYDICKKLDLDISEWKKWSIAEIFPEKFDNI